MREAGNMKGMALHAPTDAMLHRSKRFIFL